MSRVDTVVRMHGIMLMTRILLTICIHSMCSVLYREAVNSTLYNAGLHCIQMRPTVRCLCRMIDSVHDECSVYPHYPSMLTSSSYLALAYALNTAAILARPTPRPLAPGAAFGFGVDPFAVVVLLLLFQCHL